MNINILQKHVKGARHFEGADAMRIVLHTDRILVSRCRDPDGSACMQTRFEGGINRWLEEHQLGCSCGDAGTCVGTSSAQVHVVAFSPSALDALVKPLSEMDFVYRFEKKKGNNVAKFGCLEAHVLPFGMKFKLLVSDVLGELSVCLQEAESEAPLDSIAGTAVRVSFFFLAGATARAAPGCARPPSSWKLLFEGMVWHRRKALSGLLSPRSDSSNSCRRTGFGRVFHKRKEANLYGQRCHCNRAALRKRRHCY
jgi:hypothetical protein